MTNVNTKNKTRILRIALCALFVALIAIGGQIQIPFVPVPFTLQTLFVLLSGALLGPIEGFLVVIVYISMGLLGLPVFSGFTGGIESVLKPSFGFIIGFAFGALLSGLIIGKKENPNILRLIIGVISGTTLIYVFGVSYYFILKIFYIGGEINVWNIFLMFWIVFIPTDILKGAIVVIVAKKLSKFLNN